MLKRKNPKRFECLKKKANELSVLCDVDVLFLCKEDGDGNFYMWPENSGACLTMIEKYKKKGDSVLGKRRVRDETQMALSGTIQENQEWAKKARKFENPKMGLGNNLVDVVNCLEYQELLQVISWVEQTTKEVDGRVQFLMNNHNLVNEGLCINGIGCSENLDSGVEYGLWLEEVLGGSQQISDQSSLEGGECDMGDSDNNVFDVKKLEEWLENDDQESDADVSNHEFIAAFEEEMGHILHASNQNDVFVDNLEEEEHTAFEMEIRQILLASNRNSVLFDNLKEEDHYTFEAETRQILQAHNQDHVFVNNLEDKERVAFEVEIRRSLQASNQDCVLVNNLEEKDQEDDEEENEHENLMNCHKNYSEIIEISDTSDDDDEGGEVELIPSSYQWMLLDFLDHALI